MQVNIKVHLVVHTLNRCPVLLFCAAECLHGHQERYDGMALPTIFPQPLMLAATFNPHLAFQVRWAQQQQQQQVE